MNNLKEFVRNHIPETVCVCVLICVFAVMSVYTLLLYAGMMSRTENTFEKINNPVTLTEKIPEEPQKSVYNGDFFTVGNGTKYHTAECYYVKNGSEVTGISVGQIEEKDYQPCSKCIG